MNTILVATDFSPAATNAAVYALEMAMAVNKKIRLLNINDLPVTWSQIPVTTDNTNMTEGAETELNKLKKRLEDQADGRIVIETEVRTGAFFQELKAACRELQPYMVIMGSQGTTATERFLFGGHTVYAMQHLQWPLITVPPTGSFRYIRRIALACDFNNVAAATPAAAINKLVKDFHAELHVLNVGKETTLDPGLMVESEVLNELLKETAPQFHFIAHENTNKALMEFVAHYHIHLLLVLPKQHDFTDKLLHKSHTKELVMHSNVPVMALHK